MPQRLQTMIESLAVVSTTIGAAIAALVAAIADAPPVSVFNGPAILDDERLRLICIVGALGGALLNLGLYASPTPGIRPMVWKVFSSAMTGVVFTPIAIHYFGIVPNIDNLLAASFVTAIVGVGLLKMVLPVWIRFFGAKLGVSDALASNNASNPTRQPPPP